MDKLRVAFIGAGRISDLHALAYLDDERAELVALCDINIELARERGRQWGVSIKQRIFSDYHDMLALDDIDLVEISAAAPFALCSDTRLQSRPQANISPCKSRWR